MLSSRYARRSQVLQSYRQFIFNQSLFHRLPLQAYQTMPFKDEVPAYSPLHESEEGLSLSSPKRLGLNWTLIWRLAVLLLLATGNLAVFTHIYTRQTHDDSGLTTSPEEYGTL